MLTQNTQTNTYFPICEIQLQDFFEKRIKITLALNADLWICGCGKFSCLHHEIKMVGLIWMWTF